MARIQGVDLPNDKWIEISLTYLFGIGRYTARKIVEELQIDPKIKTRDLTEDEIQRIAALIDSKYRIEGQLRRQIAQNVQRLKDIGCYRGLRHRRGLPVRGQRTRTNARSRKGPKRTVATKKSIKSMR